MLYNRVVSDNVMLPKVQLKEQFDNTTGLPKKYEEQEAKGMTKSSINSFGILK